MLIYNVINDGFEVDNVDYEYVDSKVWLMSGFDIKCVLMLVDEVKSGMVKVIYCGYMCGVV